MILNYHKWSNEFVQTNKDSHQRTVIELYDDFKTAVETAMDRHIPTKIISKRTQSPWITKKIRRLHKHKQRAFNALKKENTQPNFERFTNERKNTHKVTRNAYRSYISSVCSDSPKKFWSFIKSLKVDSTLTTTGIPTLKRDGKLESENRFKAEILNDQFKSVFTDENPNLPQESSSHVPSMPEIFPGRSSSLLRELPSCLTIWIQVKQRPDGISSRLLKLAADELAPALSVIFQRSLDTNKQHGFRSKHSTESQLILTIQDLALSLNNKTQIDMVIMDFSKAFDVVPHNRLLQKLKRYGIHNKTHAWITSFLKQQQTDSHPYLGVLIT
ncbi:uncharacterized protein [Amphiura filiformis]|uniref:uncharacterized protein n=1 Tax=Amphiura filiformis TaxID=82378 RepID=UPI003B21BEA6